MKNKIILTAIVALLGFLAISLPVQARGHRHSHTSFNVSFGSLFQCLPCYQQPVVVAAPVQYYQPVVVQSYPQPVYNPTISCLSACCCAPVCSSACLSTLWR